MGVNAIPSAFWWKRFHSFAGFGLTIYLIFHLLTNAYAGLWIGEEGKEFIRQVNAIHALPHLELIEIMLLGLPILIHAFFGIYYLRTGAYNSLPSDGTYPYLNYERNRAYTWQRITSWILLIGLFGHIVHMRVIEYPATAQEGSRKYFAIRIKDEVPLHSFAEKIEVKLFNQNSISEMPEGALAHLLHGFNLAPGQLVAVSNHFGPVSLLIVREAFKSPLIVFLYTLFVFAACFHAFNGLWEFLIRWGVTLSQRAQRLALYLSTFLMVIVTFLGLVAIYGSFWIHLRS